MYTGIIKSPKTTHSLSLCVFWNVWGPVTKSNRNG